MSQSSDHHKLFALLRWHPQSLDRNPTEHFFGCGGIGDLHHGCAAAESHCHVNDDAKIS